MQILQWVFRCEKYDDIYFESRNLVIVFYTEPSGTYRHYVDYITSEVETLNINIARTLPGYYTCDMVGLLLCK